MKDNNQIQKLEVSANGRFLQFADGTPFFLLADTAWELFHRLRLDEASYYFNARKLQGFNVIQAVAISENDGLRDPNAYGFCPFLQMDPDKPDENYFKHIDNVIKLAAEYGLYVALVPTWGDKIESKFGIGPVVFNASKAYRYGKWIGNRYKNDWNIIWMNGGDRTGGEPNHQVWDALAKGIKEADPDHLMTFHPMGDASSSMWFHDAGWLNFNSCQSGHSMRHLPNYTMIMYDYSRMPAKPCLDAEPRYEDHAVNWKPDVNGFFNDYDVRQAAYWAVFAGACGHTYGAHPVWQMYAAPRQPVGFVRYTWKQALELPGASQMLHLKALMLSRPYFDRIPDQQPVDSPKVGDEHIRVTYGKNYLFCYLPLGGTVDINCTFISGTKIKAWWYNPRNGQSAEAGIYKNGTLQFMSPTAGMHCDWVLVADDVEAGFEKPGTQIYKQL